MGRMSHPQKKENDKLVDLANRFKASGDVDAFKELVQVLEGYLQYLSTKRFFYIPGYSSDDIYQEALIALATKAIPDYQEQKGPFLSFAKLCIRRHVITILKASNNKSNEPLNASMSLDVTVCNNNDDEDGPTSIANFLPSRDEDLAKLFVKLECHRRVRTMLFSKLTDLEAIVLELFLKNMSYVDIAERMNKRRRGKNRVDTKVIDNALCRIKHKAQEAEREAEEKKDPIISDFLSSS